MNLTSNQRLALQVVEQKNRRLVDVKLSVEESVRAELEARLDRETAERDRSIIEAFAAGVPKIQIARATGSTNPKVVREVLARHQNEVLALHANRYRIGVKPDELIIHLEGDDLADACRATGWKPSEAVDAGVDFATFAVRRPERGDPALVAQSRSFVEEFGRLHPTVAWGRQNSAEALSWWTEVAR